MGVQKVVGNGTVIMFLIGCALIMVGAYLIHLGLFMISLGVFIVLVATSWPTETVETRGPVEAGRAVQKGVH
jgi:uncharacterized membrane protein